MELLIIDAQGGGIGKQLAASVKKARPDLLVTAVGTNSAATAAMLRAGADRGATGENAVLAGCRRADVIAGPGEITPAMALAVGQSRAKRILIPVNHCDNIVVGVEDLNMGRLIAEAVERILKSAEEKG